MRVENKKQIIIVLLAIGLGLAATGLTGRYIQGSLKEQTQVLAKEYEQKRIKPLLGEIQGLKKEINNLKERQASLATTAMVQSKGAGAQATPAVAKTSLAVRTPAGKRAYTVKIDSLSAVGGLIAPGDYVDILGHLKVPDPTAKNKKNKETITSVIFQNIQVLAVGTNVQSAGSYGQQAKALALRVTLALDPEQIGLVSFAQRVGKLQLVLRPPAETQIEMLQVATWNALSNYVLENQGTELVVPRLQANIEPVKKSVDEVKPYIQIFRAGQEL